MKKSHYGSKKSVANVVWSFMGEDKAVCHFFFIGLSIIFGPMRFNYGQGYIVETKLQSWLWWVPIKTCERHKVYLSVLHCPGLLRTLCYSAAATGYRKPPCFCFDCFLSRALWSWLKLMTFTTCFSCIPNNLSWPLQQALINLDYTLYRKPFTGQHYIVAVKITAIPVLFQAVFFYFRRTSTVYSVTL